MKYNDVKVGLLVEDTWWPERYYGRVIKKLKTRIKIQTSTTVITYDKPHVQFLRPIHKKVNKRK